VKGKKKAAKPKKRMNVEKEITNLQWQISRLHEFTEQLRESITELNGTKTEPKKEYKRPRVERNMYYCTIGVAGALHAQHEEGTVFDNNSYVIGNYYHTNEEAAEARDKQIILQQLKDLAMELNKGVEIDWDNSGQHKHCICVEYTSHGRVLTPDYACSVQLQGTIYCLSEYFLEVALERIGEGKLERLFE
jgi:hypothetical protein